ncbi:MAG: hypothetical protein ACJ77B_01985 [Chloroflexota bacterium]
MSDPQRLPIRSLFLAATILLPWRMRRYLYVRLLGWHLAPTARIGLSYVNAKMVSMADGSRIGPLNVVRNLSLLEMGPGSSIGQWNWLTQAPEFTSAFGAGGSFRGLKLGDHAAVVSRHYLDCSGGITIGNGALIAGVRSTFITHQVEIVAGTLGTAPILVGEQCITSANVCFAPGSVLPDRSVVAMGAVVVGELTDQGAMYAGVPARVVRHGIDGGRWFSRKRGYLGVAPADVLTPGDTLER